MSHSEYSEEEEEDWAAIVIDNGSRSIKAGFSGDEAPRMVIPSIVGYWRHECFKEQLNVKDRLAVDCIVSQWSDHKITTTAITNLMQKYYTHIDDYLAGKEAMDKRGILSLKYPIFDGLITSWDNVVYTVYYIVILQSEFLFVVCCLSIGKIMASHILQRIANPTRRTWNFND